MLHPRVVVLRSLVLSLLITAAPDLILGLRDVSVTVPTAVKKGDNAHLICNYDMEGDTLYSVKWYKGRREFYRYTPKENPAMKIFPLTGIFVERSLSNQSHVVLTAVEPSISGKFSCEVSADAPSFHTSIVSGDMEIVELPEQRPFLTGIHSRYRLGDIINGNCSSYYSKPAANLTWTINDIPITPNQVKMYTPVKNPINNLESSVSEINLILTHQYFIRGRLKLKCVARIHGIYEQDAEKIIEEDRPRILASGRSPDVNLFSIDQQGEGDFDQNELYLTHYKDLSSSASPLSLIKGTQTRFIHLATIVNVCIYIVLALLTITINNLNILTTNTRRRYSGETLPTDSPKREVIRDKETSKSSQSIIPSAINFCKEHNINTSKSKGVQELVNIS